MQKCANRDSSRTDPDLSIKVKLLSIESFPFNELCLNAKNIQQDPFKWGQRLSKLPQGVNAIGPSPIRIVVGTLTTTSNFPMVTGRGGEEDRVGHRLTMRGIQRGFLPFIMPSGVSIYPVLFPFSSSYPTI